MQLPAGNLGDIILIRSTCCAKIRVTLPYCQETGTLNKTNKLLSNYSSQVLLHLAFKKHLFCGALCFAAATRESVLAVA